jgi:PKD repeat protein
MSTKTISLTIRNQDPTASFEYFPMEPPTGDIVSFSAEASDFDRPSGDLEYEWTFGDGSSGFGPTPQNEYDDEGSYDVTLTVTDEYGRAQRRLERSPSRTERRRRGSPTVHELH